MPSFVQDLRHSVRMLTKNPGLTITCVVTLSLGIGLTTTMFSIINGCMFQQLPFEDSRRLMYLNRNNLEEGVEEMDVPIHDFLDWRRQQTSFEDLAGFYGGTVNFGNTGDRAVRYQGSFITPSVFGLLGVQPIIGRIFTEEEMRPDTPHVIVVGHDVWQTRFAGDPEVVGRPVRVNGESSTVIGVMPPDFLFPYSEEVWLPLRLDPITLERGGGVWLDVMGKLKEEVTINQARAELTAIAGGLAEEYPDTNEGVGVGIKPYYDRYVDDELKVLFLIMLAAVFAVLVIACINVANILLARAAMRTKEMAVRTSLGANRRRLIGQLLAEAAALSVVGALIGLGLGHVGVTLFDVAVAPSDPPWWFDFSVDMNVVMFVVVLALISSLLSGLFPALQASRANISEVLKDDTRAASSFRMSRFSKVLVVVEIAFSCGLLFTAGLMTKSVINLNTYDYGIDSENVLTARVGLFETDYLTEESRRQFWQKLYTRLNAIPGVVSASLATHLPLSGSNGGDFVVEGEEYPPETDYPFTRTKAVTPGYFKTFGIKVLQGREFTSTDYADGLLVGLVNQSFAERFMPGESPLGRRMRSANAEPDDPWYTIVGVVADEWLTNEAQNEDHQTVYGCLFQDDARFLSLAIKTMGDPMAMAPRVRDEVMAIDNDLPIYWVWPITQVIDERKSVFEAFSVLMIAAGFIALFLGSVGLYGVIAFSVSRRTQEIGVRMALGAQPGQVLKMILRQGSLQLGTGVIIGLGLALALAQGMRLLLIGVAPTDLTVFAAIVSVLVATGVLACFIPARRATRIDPANALRYE